MLQTTNKSKINVSVTNKPVRVKVNTTSTELDVHTPTGPIELQACVGGVNIDSNLVLAPIQFPTKDDFPKEGSTNVIYVATEEDALYYWSVLYGDYVCAGRGRAEIQDGPSAEITQELENKIKKLYERMTGIGGKNEPQTVIEAIDMAKQEAIQYVDNALAWQEF